MLYERPRQRIVALAFLNIGNYTVFAMLYLYVCVKRSLLPAEDGDRRLRLLL